MALQRSKTWAAILTAAAGLLAAGTASLQAWAYFEGLGFLPGQTASETQAVSADAAVVVGTSGTDVFRWTPTGGMQNLGHPSEVGPDFKYSLHLSADGSVIVGSFWEHVYYYPFAGPPTAIRWTQQGGFAVLGTWGDARSTSADGSVTVGRLGTEAYRWTQPAGMTGLGFLPGASESEAFSVTPDGSVIVGMSGSSSGAQAFRWTQAGGMLGLGYLAGGSVSSAVAVTPDGRVVVGDGRSSALLEPFRWTEATGMVGLGVLPSSSDGHATMVSQDGSVIVGISSLTGGTTRGFRWTAETGVVDLGDPPGLMAADTIPIDMSADGTVIVGVHMSGSQNVAFLWREGAGMRRLSDFLKNEYALDLTGWSLDRPMLSDDARIIVGTGINPSHMQEAWIAVIPEPATLALLAAGAGALAMRRRWKRAG